MLDVHEARLYPFDTYHLTSTLRAVTSADNDTIPITRLLTISDTSSFIVSPSDSASYIVLSNSSTDAPQLPSRNLDMEIRRPGEARFFALMLFGVNWMLAHATIAYVALAWKSDDTERVMKYLVFCIITMLVIPQVRNAMPDAPGLDGKSTHDQDSTLIDGVIRHPYRPDWFLRADAHDGYRYHHASRNARPTRVDTA